MQKVNRRTALTDMLEVPFEHRAELFKKAVEKEAKKLFVTLNCGYIQSCHDEHVVIIDKFDDDNMVYYDTLTRDEWLKEE